MRHSYRTKSLFIHIIVRRMPDIKDALRRYLAVLVITQNYDIFVYPLKEGCVILWTAIVSLICLHIYYTKTHPSFRYNFGTF